MKLEINFRNTPNNTCSRIKMPATHAILADNRIIARGIDHSDIEGRYYCFGKDRRMKRQLLDIYVEKQQISSKAFNKIDKPLSVLLTG